MADDLIDGLLAEENALDAYFKEDDILEPLLEDLEMIEDDGIRLFTRAMLLRVPDAWWTLPPGLPDEDYPPDVYASPGGNVTNIRRMLRVIHQLIVSYQLSSIEMDYLISAVLLHNVTKIIEKENTHTYDTMHPYTTDMFTIRQRKKDRDKGEHASSTLQIDDDDMLVILRLIRCQLGPWSAIPETIPASTLEWIMHTATLVASNLHHIIDGEEINEWRWIKEDHGQD